MTKLTTIPTLRRGAQTTARLASLVACPPFCHSEHLSPCPLPHCFPTPSSSYSLSPELGGANVLCDDGRQAPQENQTLSVQIRHDSLKQCGASIIAGYVVTIPQQGTQLLRCPRRSSHRTLGRVLHPFVKKCKCVASVSNGTSQSARLLPVVVRLQDVRRDNGV